MSEYAFNDLFLYAGLFCIALALYWIWQLRRDIKKGIQTTGIQNQTEQNEISKSVHRAEEERQPSPEGKKEA